MRGSADEMANGFAKVHGAVLRELKGWEDERWHMVREVHGETKDAAALVWHLVARSRRVAQVVREQSGLRSLATGGHASVEDLGANPKDLLAAVDQAGRECLEVIRSLDEAQIERLRRSEIDGEPDVFLASCGLVGHWTYHLPALSAS